jgi:hypothetical protein
MKNIFLQSVSAALIVIIAGSCQKMDRPSLGDYPQDTNPPGGPLKFYAAFDGTTANPLMNAVDSIRANFPSSNPLASTDGASGKALQGAADKAVNYPGANDFKNATSCTIAMWVNNTVNPRTELYFSLVDNDYWHASSAFLLVEHATPDKCQLKFALMDHWVEYIDNFNEPLFDGQWHHLAFTYDETTSKLLVYFDGQNIPTPGTSGDFTSNGAPLGPLNLKNASNLVVSGWNKHAGLTGPTDSWISSFSGKMDQFRLYNKVLSPGEIQALYNSRL